MRLFTTTNFYYINHISNWIFNSNNNRIAHPLSNVIVAMKEQEQIKIRTTVTTSTTLMAQKPLQSTTDLTTVTATIHPIPSKEPENTFYRRPLPEKTCIALSSRKGRHLFNSALSNGGIDGCFFPLSEQHSTQSEPAYCGISSLVIALNALAIDPKRSWRGSLWRWYDESMLNCCVDLNQVKTTGITVGTFKCLAVCQGVHASATYGDSCTDNNNGSNDNNFEHQFRTAVIDACINQGKKNSMNNQANDDENDDDEATAAQVLTSVLLASYDRKVLGQTGSGHFSPITAYDPISDSVLIMDTARFKYGSHWVKLSLLADAMKPIDPDSGRSRGFIVLTNPMAQAASLGASTTASLSSAATTYGGTLPVSVLLRSEMIRNNPARKDYKSYLDNRHRQQLTTNLDNVVDFWTKNGTDVNYIWELVKPKCLLLNEDLCLLKLINGVRSLINNLIRKHEQQQYSNSNEANTSLQLVLESSSFDTTDQYTSNSYCKSVASYLIPISSMEVIYITYLASLSDTEIEELFDKKLAGLYNDDAVLGETAETTAFRSYQCQLIAEAELIRFSIDISDEIVV
jgi:glutathione gamma-glutamylcysteinyltransferase